MITVGGFGGGAITTWGWGSIGVKIAQLTIGCRPRILDSLSLQPRIIDSEGGPTPRIDSSDELTPRIVGSGRKCGDC
jgi:hypothetical protein